MRGPECWTIGISLLLGVGLSVACGGAAQQDATGSATATGGTPTATGGTETSETGTGGTGTGSTSAASGSQPGSGGDGESLSFVPSEAAADCELTPESTEWRRSIAREECFSTDLFFNLPRDGNVAYPTFHAGELGAGGATPMPLDFCPTAPSLDWECSVSEGTRCSFPQCVIPTTGRPRDGECCYIVASVSGV